MSYLLAYLAQWYRDRPSSHMSTGWKEGGNDQSACRSGYFEGSGIVREERAGPREWYESDWRQMSLFCGEARHERRRRIKSLSERRGRHVIHLSFRAAVYSLPRKVQRTFSFYFRDIHRLVQPLSSLINSSASFTGIKCLKSSMTRL
jgi:hypothetical protein